MSTQAEPHEARRALAGRSASPPARVLSTTEPLSWRERTMSWPRPATWQVLLGIAARWSLMVAATPSPAFATTGGPELVRPLGWNPSSGAVFFSVVHVGESGNAPTILRLTLGSSANTFEPLGWSDGADDDSTYRANLRRLTRPLRRLPELWTTTIPQDHEVAALDTLRDDSGEWPRFRVRVRWFNGACDGWVEAVTYLDPSLRMIRLYQMPGRTDRIGVFSFVGVRTEFGYERQVPVLLPRDRNAVVRIGQE